MKQVKKKPINDFGLILLINVLEMVEKESFNSDLNMFYIDWVKNVNIVFKLL